MPKDDGLTPEDMLSPAQQALEAALSALAPTAARASRDRVMFHAGRTAGRRRTRPWQAAAAALAAALCLSLVLLSRPHRIADGPAGPPDAPMARAAWPGDEADDEPWPAVGDSYLHLRDKVLAEGVAALPDSPVARAEGPWTRADALERLLNENGQPTQGGWQ